MTRTHCPSCGSNSRGIPGARFGKLSHYTCRHAWHMPALTEKAEAALDFVADVDVMFSGDMELPKHLLAVDPTRIHSGSDL